MTPSIGTVRTQVVRWLAAVESDLVRHRALPPADVATLSGARAALQDVVRYIDGDYPLVVQGLPRGLEKEAQP